jgi:hypothetical protein
MIRNLAAEWRLPAMLLIAPYNLKKASRTKQATPAKKKIGRKRRQKQAATGKRDAA